MRMTLIQCNLYIIIDEITVEFYDNGFTKNIVIVKYKNYFFSVINILDNYYDSSIFSCQFQSTLQHNHLERNTKRVSYNKLSAPAPLRLAPFRLPQD